MFWLSMDSWVALLSIILIDLVLAGDNAVVIGLAARNVPKPLQKKVIIWGTAGAVAIRAVATLAVVWLLEIPGLLLGGGLVLIWIAYKLLTDNKPQHDLPPSNKVWGAVRTILVADAVMGFDNVLAIAGAAHGHFLLVVIGLLISVPIVVWGSTWVLRFMERFPSFLYVGGAVLALTAGKMISHEPFIEDFINDIHLSPWLITGVVMILVLLSGWFRNKRLSKIAHPKQEGFLS